MFLIIGLLIVLGSVLGGYLMEGGKFPRLKKKQASARLNEIAQLLTAL